jgi:hypothetical protein
VVAPRRPRLPSPCGWSITIRHQCDRAQDLLSPEVVLFDGTVWWYEDYWISVNKKDGPRVSSRVKMKISRMFVTMDLAGLSCSGRLHRRTLLGASCLEIAGSDGIWSGAPVFLSDRLVLERALRSSAGSIIRNDFSFHGEVS